MDLELRLSQLREIEQDLLLLLASPGWNRLKTAMDEQLRLRRNQRDLTRLESLDACFKLATMLGEGDGIKIMITYPEAYLDQVRQEIRDVLLAQEMENENA